MQDFSLIRSDFCFLADTGTILISISDWGSSTGLAIRQQLIFFAVSSRGATGKTPVQPKMHVCNGLHCIAMQKKKFDD